MTDHPLTETAAAEMYGTDEEGHTLYAWPNPERAWVVRAMGAAFDAGQKYQDDLEDDTIRSIMKDVHHLRVERDAADNAVADLTAQLDAERFAHANTAVKVKRVEELAEMLELESDELSKFDSALSNHAAMVKARTAARIRTALNGDNA